MGANLKWVARVGLAEPTFDQRPKMLLHVVIIVLNILVKCVLIHTPVRLIVFVVARIE